MKRSVRAAAVAALAAASCGPSQTPAVEHVREDPTVTAKSTDPQVAGDFLRDAEYVDERGVVAGVRWVHRVHGMPVVTLRIQSVPQVFLAFHTPPVSDRGEPHTGEHLLLGKGTKGKMLSAEQGMSLVDSTAWTAQTDVCFSWNCAAGKETFMRSVEQYLDALLLPDFTDEEIRREVCHIGPVVDEKTGKLSLDEKGTIYQEMVDTYEKRWNVWTEMQKRLWGEGHPLAFSAGGEPSAVRTCTAEHVRSFHAAHYHLAADTQMLVALPDTIPEREFLERLSKQMSEIDARPALRARPKTSFAIPPGRAQADRSFRAYPYPNANEGDGGTALLAWKPVPTTSLDERVAAETLFATLAGGESATIYKRLMDSSTREFKTDAAELTSGVDASKIDLLPWISLDGLPPRNATKEAMGKIVGIVRDEIARVAKLEGGSAELKTFNEKALVKLTEREKDLRKQLNTPPLFGFRGQGGFWLDHLRLVDLAGGKERSVTLAPSFAKLRGQIERGANPWRAVIAQFGLDDEPFTGASVASKAELERRTNEHAKRIEGYIADAEKRYRTSDAQKAIAQFKTEYDAKTAELDAMEKSLPKPHLVPDVPLVPDPSIKMERMEVGRDPSGYIGPGNTAEVGVVDGFRGVFDNMTFAETSICLDLNETPDELRPWLAILPRMLVESGVVIDGKPVPYDVAAERRAKEIYGLATEYAVRPSRGRHELRITASGANLNEAKRAIEWIGLCLEHPWIDPANVQRLRDLVAQEIQATRGRLGGADEDWVQDPARAVRWQADPLFLATSSIHARLFLLARCEWRLMDAPSAADAVKVEAGLGAIVAAAGPDAKTTSASIDALVAKWKDSKDAVATKWLVPIAHRINEMVGDMAPTTIAKDLRTLADVCRLDVTAGASVALKEIDQASQSARTSARVTLTGSRATLEALTPSLVALFGDFGRQPHVPPPDTGVVYSSPRLVDVRLADHEPAGPAPLHYGFVHGAGTTGVFVLSADSPGLDDTDDASLVDGLAGRVFGGAGAHSFFMKTWGAGLAYSNGTSVNTYEKRQSYYAERCPDLVQTMSFVSGLVKDVDTIADPSLVEYAVAGAVTYSRENDRYEARTHAAADEMVDGDTPERVAKWRRAALAFRDRADAWTLLQPRIAEVTGRVLPGVPPRSRDVKGGLFFTIAPAPMLAKWEAFVRERDGASERVVRIYGRDFWMAAR